MKYIFALLFSFLIISCSNSINKTDTFKAAQSLIDKEDFNASLLKLDLLIKHFPDFDSAYMERGFVKYSLGDYESGIEDCNKAIELNYANLNAYFYRASCYGGLGDYNSAFEDYSHIVKLGPSATYNFALFERSIIYDYGEQYDAAISDMQEIIKTDSLNCEVTSGLGVLYYSRKKDFEKGLQYLNSAIEKCPEYADAYYKRGKFYTDFFNKNKDYKKALIDLNKAIELNPKQDMYYLSRGLVYRSLGQVNNAIKDLDYAISLNPENGFAYSNRGHIKLEELNDKKGAEQDLKKAKELGIN